jgi:hypothetical protein
MRYEVVVAQDGEEAWSHLQTAAGPRWRFWIG